ncbi:glycosyltransferase family 4 protein [Paenibacillus sp. strain BS8-2]
MRKVLIVSTVSRQFYLFEKVNIEILTKLGFSVHAAANFSDSSERLDELKIIRHHIDFERSPFSIKNIKAYIQIKKLMREEEFYAVHCHSPMGGVVSRLAAKAVGVSKVFYTAHGFHFYKGAPFLNWLLYYPVEKWLSQYTDLIITINNEDFITAKRFKAASVKRVPGIGVNISEYKESNLNKELKLLQLNIPTGKFILMSVGELNQNKNHEIIIRALAEIKNSNIHYIICGQGQRFKFLEELSEKLNVQEQVHLLGYRNDINEIIQIADVFVFPSYREGLSVALMEAMAAKLPIICSKIRGNVDLVSNGEGGLLIEPNNIKGFKDAILSLYSNSEFKNRMKEVNYKNSYKYSKEIIKGLMYEIYENEMQGSKKH